MVNVFKIVVQDILVIKQQLQEVYAVHAFLIVRFVQIIILVVHATNFSIYKMEINVF